jgi:ABC-type nitrate/sulfonate/bicarbonate transport system substrate-binding protein
VTKASYRSITGLKGKKVAFNRGSNVQYLVIRTLALAKLRLDDVEVENLAPAGSSRYLCFVGMVLAGLKRR